MLAYKVPSSTLFNDNTFFFLKLLDKRFIFIYKYKIYLSIPNFVFWKKTKNIWIFFFPNLKQKKAFLFLNYFLKFLRKVTQLKRVKLILVGLGFKGIILETNILSFKLGFSHVVNIRIPASVKVVIVKNSLYLEGSNPQVLGNFANQIKHLKYPDNYKGKGFWFRSEKRKLKPVKKA
ncbi:MAG: hypothetical protein RLZZ414_2218 [Bacteroidota bacterium]|jgi:hypothetical protein